MNISYSGSSFPINSGRSVGITTSGQNITGDEYIPFSYANTNTVPNLSNTQPPFNYAMQPQTTNFPTDIQHHVRWNIEPYNQPNFVTKPTSTCSGPYQNMYSCQAPNNCGCRNCLPPNYQPQIQHIIQPYYIPIVCPPSFQQQQPQQQPPLQPLYNSQSAQHPQNKYYNNNYSGPTNSYISPNNTPYYPNNGMYSGNNMNGASVGVQIGPSTPLNSNYVNNNSRYGPENQMGPMNQGNGGNEFCNTTTFVGPSTNFGGPSNFDQYQSQQKFNSYNKPPIYQRQQPNNMQQQMKYDNQAMQYRLEQERLFRTPQFQLKFHNDGQTSTTDIRYYNQRYIPVAFRIQTATRCEVNADCTKNIYKNYTPLVYNNDESAIFQIDHTLTCKDEACQKCNQNTDAAQTDVEMKDASVTENKNQDDSKAGPSNSNPSTASTIPSEIGSYEGNLKNHENLPSSNQSSVFEVNKNYPKTPVKPQFKERGSLTLAESVLSHDAASENSSI